MKNKKRKLLKFGIMCLMPLLALLITISNSYAYYLNDDGNIQSENLYNKNTNIAFNKLISHDNGNEFYNFNGYYISDYIPVNPLTYYSCNNWNSYYCWWYDINKNPVSVLPSNVTTAFAPSNAYYLRLSSNDIEDLMLNSGSTLKDYEPFGTWYNSDNAFQPLNVAFNNCRVDLFNYNISNPSLVSSANLTIYNSQLITLDNIPTLQSIILNDENTRYGLKFYLNNPINYILNFQMNNNVYQVYVVLSNSVTGQVFSFEYGSNVENYNLVCNTNNNYYDTILYYTLLSPDYNYFSMYVNTDSASFNNGYNIGVSDGYDNGYSTGYKTGYNIGLHDSGDYQRGYNDGVQQDLESSGFRTLITTILSYPVNMVRESLNFEFMGIHVASIVLFIISLGIVAFVIKRFKD